MIQLHPEILRKHGKNEFVVLPYEEFEQLQELLADVQDLLELRAAKEQEAQAPTRSLDELKAKFGMS